MWPSGDPVIVFFFFNYSMWVRVTRSLSTHSYARKKMNNERISEAEEQPEFMHITFCCVSLGTRAHLKNKTHRSSFC